MSTRAAEQNLETSIRLRRLAIALSLLAVVLPMGFGRPARAQAGAEGGPQAQAQASKARVHIVEISGLIDAVQSDFLTRAMRDAQRAHAEVLVVRLDSQGSVISEQELAVLAFRVVHSSTPIAVWVGPGRDARVQGGAATLARLAAVLGKAPGASIETGRARPRAIPIFDAATLGDFIVALDGKTVGDRVIKVPTKVVRREGRPPQRELDPAASVAFDEPSLIAQLLHAVATPSAAYLLLIVALLLIVFEFFTGGIGVAAAVAIASLALSAYGLDALPTRWWAVAIVAAATVGFAVDVQSGAPRAWTAIGTALLFAGSSLLFEAGLRVPIVVLILLNLGVVLFMVSAMPAVVRTRFATPTIGRDEMIGEQGEAISPIAPEGIVKIRDAPWRARTNRATPINQGQTVRVTSIDGLLLEVEPLEGAARDAGH